MEIEEFENVVRVFDSELELEIPKEDYDILKQIADKYSLPVEVLFEIIIREEKAVKIGKKRGIKKDLMKIINNYFSSRFV
ncbi:hypothetical protein [Thermococcus sp. M39]|uniref:hypothetical protein n=1 Tax=Thermococcus sp. M39 TaxID=1638262 RepID=UPI0014387890|nr:hypothetical protein [Thermococcus sp. M39]